MFWKNLLRNLLILGAILVALLIISPGIMSQVYGLLGKLFGPLLIFLIIVAGLPRSGRSSNHRN